MKINGFTLAELLGVIVILALISMIAVPAVTDSLQNYRNSLCDTQLREIEAAARTWGADNLYNLPDEDNETYTVSLRTLSDYGYIAAEIENPVAKDKFDLDTTQVIITKIGKKYTYKIDDETLKTCE